METKEEKIGSYRVLYRVEWWGGTGHINLLEITKNGCVQDLRMSQEIPIVEYLYRKEGIL